MISRYNAWRRRQRSLIRFVLVPDRVRLTARGPRWTSRVVEIRSSAWL